MQYNVGIHAHLNVVRVYLSINLFPMLKREGNAAITMGRTRAVVE